MLVSSMRAALGLALSVALVAACGSSRPTPKPPAAAALRVAVPPDAPPYAFRQGDRLVGLEVDFAGELAKALGRPLNLIAVDFNDIIPTVLSGRADVAMTGMTITPAREVRIAFSDPYLRSGLIAVMRREDAARYPSPRSVVDSATRIGVVEGTTGERFVRERFAFASPLVYPRALAAVTELRQRRIELVVDDAPIGIWFVSSDEANLSALLKPLNVEHLAWGMRRGDEALRDAVNGALARWRTDGTRERILARWIPYWQQLEQAAPQ